ncbi:hypothetical protein [Bacillus paralicheniformis]|nr:hypothetical protein [Bacillus paralicheniformis]
MKHRTAGSIRPLENEKNCVGGLSAGSSPNRARRLFSAIISSAFSK